VLDTRRSFGVRVAVLIARTYAHRALAAILDTSDQAQTLRAS
jgi:hypothetical protein